MANTFIKIMPYSVKILERQKIRENGTNKQGGRQDFEIGVSGFFSKEEEIKIFGLFIFLLLPIPKYGVSIDTPDTPLTSSLY